MATLPTRAFAGVQVPDTPLITKALALCRKHLNDLAYNHSVRTWLFGFIIAAQIPELQGRDLEAHAIAAILHDLGWDETGEFVTQEKRFEVDGANAARDFLKSEAGDWDKHRLQLVWDAIALHTTTSVAYHDSTLLSKGHAKLDSLKWHKEPEVVATSYGIYADFAGPDRAIGGHLTWEAWNVVVKELPRLGLKDGVEEICCWLCRTKPETTYDNFVGQYGERYVQGYTLAGKKDIDFMEASRLD